MKVVVVVVVGLESVCMVVKLGSSHLILSLHFNGLQVKLYIPRFWTSGCKIVTDVLFSTNRS